MLQPSVDGKHSERNQSFYWMSYLSYLSHVAQVIVG